MEAFHHPIGNCMVGRGVNPLDAEEAGHLLQQSRFKLTSTIGARGDDGGDSKPNDPS